MSDTTHPATSVHVGDRIKRGVVAGIVAGIVFAVASMMWTAATGPGATAPLQMIASLPSGGDEMQPLSAATITLGVAIHMVLSIVYGAVFALVLPRGVSTMIAYLAGAAFGLALYLINFTLLANVAFELFLMANQAFEVVIHIVFGLLLVPFVLPATRIAGRNLTDQRPAR